MGRKRLAEGEKLEPFTIGIKGKYLKGQNLDELRYIAHKSIVEHVELSKTKNSKK